jgi:hypothetical protein
MARDPAAEGEEDAPATELSIRSSTLINSSASPSLK